MMRKELPLMKITYYTNGSMTTKSLTEWFFGKKAVEDFTTSALNQHKATKQTTFKFWQDGTGYLTVQIG